MEAKDTVMDFAEQAKTMEKAKIKAGCIVRRQAEISFKAGIREAVEWIKSRYGLQIATGSVAEEEWQTKLKEWEIE